MTKLQPFEDRELRQALHQVNPVQMKQLAKPLFLYNTYTFCPATEKKQYCFFATQYAGYVSTLSGKQSLVGLAYCNAD